MTDSPDITFAWLDDWSLGVSHLDFYGEAYDDIGEPVTCEVCMAYGPDGELLASLGCIDDATEEYRREIEGELREEAVAELRNQTERNVNSLLWQYS